MGEEKTHSSASSVWGNVLFLEKNILWFSCLISEKAFFSTFFFVSCRIKTKWQIDQKKKKINQQTQSFCVLSTEVETEFESGWIFSLLSRVLQFY